MYEGDPGAVNSVLLSSFLGLLRGQEVRGSWDFSRTGRAPGRISGILPLVLFASFLRTGMRLGDSLDPSAQGLNTGVYVQGNDNDFECPGSYAKKCDWLIRKATVPLA